ncbi:MAG TPA: hemolysin family protein, partial [Actinomycetota bacterium]|nr:hemolysin family protein [Actinomycetota bacterium]
MFGLLIALFLILANGFFVAAEFGLVASDRSKIEQLAEEGNRSARATLKALKGLSFQLSGAQLGITITSLVLGFVVQPTIGRALEPLVDRFAFVPERSVLAVSVAAALVIATGTQMIVSELIPQNLAIARPLRTAFFVALPLRLFNGLFRPLIVFLNASANATVRLLGFEPRDELKSVHSLEELELLIRSSREEGAIAEEDFTLLARSINFADKVAADVLVPRTALDALARDETLTDLTELALETGHSRFPVFEGDIDNV